MRSSSGCGTDDCGRISATSRPSTMPSPPSTRPSDARGRRSSAFVREDFGEGERLCPPRGSSSPLDCGDRLDRRRSLQSGWFRASLASRTAIRAKGSEILELAQTASAQFLTQNPADQAKLLKMLLSNCAFDSRKPFYFLGVSRSTCWRERTKRGLAGCQGRNSQLPGNRGVRTCSRKLPRVMGIT